MTSLTAYEAIQSFYKDKVTSHGVPYMQHIDEGLMILNEREASQEIKDAFCLHPIFQADSEILDAYRQMCLGNGYLLFEEGKYYVNHRILMLVLEYRKTANNYLPIHVRCSEKYPQQSRLSGVNLMLVADKVQNYKDFLAFNQFRKNRRDLFTYFHDWFDVLEVTQSDYEKYEALMLAGSL